MADLLKALSPVEALNKLYEIDPVSARFLIGGIGVFAAAAIVLAWGIDTNTMLLIGAYVLGMGLLLSIVAGFSAFLRRVLGTFTVLMIITTVMLFFVAAIWDKPKPAYCLAQFWRKCEDVAADVSRANAKSLDAQVDVPPTIALPGSAAGTEPTATEAATNDMIATASAGLAQETAPAASVPEAGQPVYIQFAGLITRESIAELNAALRRGGWNVQSSNGERIDLAAGLNEVRYADAAARPAALALANAVTATKITSRPVSIRQFPQVGKNLELWISN